MSKCLIVISDSNPQSYTHKSILPTVKRMYAKKNWDFEIINLYREGFDITDTNKDNVFVKSFKHQIKSATHIHFIATTSLFGFSPMLIGFFDQVLTEGFAYTKKKGFFKSTYQPHLGKKDVWFHVSHTQTKATKLNLSWLKLKQTIPAVFENAEVLQYGLECANHANLYKKLGNLTESLNKEIHFLAKD